MKVPGIFDKAEGIVDVKVDAGVGTKRRVAFHKPERHVHIAGRNIHQINVLYFGKEHSRAVGQSSAETKPEQGFRRLFHKQQGDETLHNETGGTSPAEGHEIFIQDGLPTGAFDRPIGAQDTLADFRYFAIPLHAFQDRSNHSSFGVRRVGIQMAERDKKGQGEADGKQRGHDGILSRA